jgi:hypothetical protein
MTRCAYGVVALILTSGNINEFILWLGGCAAALLVVMGLVVISVIRRRKK